MEKLSIEDVYFVLKTLCNSFMKDPNADKVTQIIILVNRTPNTIIQKIYDDILYPLTYHIKNNTFRYT
jgi:hypothetical protein